MPRHDAAAHRDDILSAHFLRTRMRRRILLFIEHDLRDSRAIAHVQKNQLPQIAPAMHPSRQRDFAIDVGGAQFAARIRALPISQCVQLHRQLPRSEDRSEARSDKRYASNSDSPSFCCELSASRLIVKMPAANSSSPMMMA